MAKSIKKIMVITQRVDSHDPVMGFFIDWLGEIAKNAESVVVVALSAGEYILPSNVYVHSSVRWKNSFFKKIKFILTIGKLVPGVDAVFAHMCPEYVLAAAPISIFFKKPIFLWFVHRAVNWRLKLAAVFVNKIFTVGPETCKIKSSKIVIAGHGINTLFFKPEALEHQVFTICCVGRISPIKDQRTLIKALNDLARIESLNFKLLLVGGAYLPSDKKYEEELTSEIFNLGDRVVWQKHVNYFEMLKIYYQSDLLVNLCPTGGKDKVVLEAMACGLPVLVANRSFVDELSSHPECFFEHGNVGDLISKIKYFSNLDIAERRGLGISLSKIVTENHSLGHLTQVLFNHFNYAINKSIDKKMAL